jgi:putative acetyltransferase
VIRPIEQRDVAEALVLIAETLAEFGLAFGQGSTTDDELRQLPGAYVDRGGMFWIAERDGQLLGTCGVFPLEPGVFELRKMYLRPASRGLGLGVGLLEVAVAWCREHAGRTLVLDTVEGMTRAIAFYEAHGFTRDDSKIRGSRCTRGYARSLVDE